MVQPLIPNQPHGQPDWYSPPGYGAGAGAGYGSPSASTSGGSYQYDGQTVPRATPEDPYAEVRWWQMHSADLADKAFKEQNAFQQLQIKNQREDAQKALAQAMQIAQLTDQTSRYGTDVGSRDRLVALEVNQQQFRANHALAERGAARDDARLGLDTAKAYTEYSQTPDMMWARNDFVSALNNVRGGGGPTPIAAQGSPEPRSWSDFAALQGFGNVPGVTSNQSPGAVQVQGSGAGGGGSGTDPRMTAASAIMKALPPSEGFGHDDNDWAALRGIESLYLGSKPGQVERLGAPRRKIAEAGLRRLGYDPALVENDRISSLPGQGGANRY